MVDYKNIQRVVVSGLKKYLGCPVIRTNQNTNAETPNYPYLSYTITTLTNENKGTYGEYEDGIDRKPVTQTWSITAQSDNNDESVMLAGKAKEWLDHYGSVHLNDNGIIVQSVGSISNRDNVLTSEYECKNGFDVFFWLFDEVENPVKVNSYIEEAEIKNKN